MELALQIISTDKSVRSVTKEDLKDFNSQSLTTQEKKGEQLVSMMLAIEKALNLLGDDIVELHTKNESLKNKVGSYEAKWLDESEARLLRQIDDEKKRKYKYVWDKKTNE